MKTPVSALSAFIVASFFPAFSQAYSNPLIRVCQVQGGIFNLLAPGEANDLPTCVFGEAWIGAADLVAHLDGNSDQAVDEFLSSTASSSVTVCTDHGSEQVDGQDSNGAPYSLCKFPDGSTIDARTLARGANDPENASLHQALMATPST